MNRYTQITPAGFDPLSVEEIMLVPLGKQKMYEEQEGKLAEMMIDSQYLPQDKEKVEAKLSEFNTAKLEVSERLSNTGDIRNTAKQIMELKAEKERLMSSAGEVGRAKAAYDRHMKYEEEMLKNPRIDMSDARRFINYSLSSYQGLDNGEYTPFYGANSVNGMEKSLLYGEKIAPQTLTNYILNDKKMLERFGGLWGIGDVYSADGQRRIESLIRNNYSTIIKDPEFTAPIIYDSLKMDRELNDYLYAVGESSGLRGEQLDAYVDSQLQSFALAGANNTMRQDYSASQDIQNMPTTREPNIDPNPFGEGDVFAYNHSTRTIFDKASTNNEIVANYNKLIEEGNDEQRAHGNRIKLHHTRALNEFEQHFPDIVEDYNNVPEYLKNIATDVGLSISDIMSSVLNVVVGSQVYGDKSFFHKEKEGTGYVLYKVNPTAFESNLEHHTPLKRFSSEEFEKLKNDTGEYRDNVNKYEKELDNYLHQYADKTRSYILTDLKDSDNNVINRDISNIIKAKPEANIKVTSGVLNDTRLDHRSSDALLTSLKYNPNYKIELVSFTGENENGVPEMKVSFANSQNGDYGVIDIQLDKLFTPGSMSKDVESYVLKQYKKHGGVTGAIIADRATDRITYKDIVPNSLIDFKESNLIKRHLTGSINKRLESIIDKDYKIDIAPVNAPNGEIKYEMVVGKSEDGNDVSTTLRWDMLFDSADDLGSVGTTSMARYFMKDLMNMTGSENITPEHLYRYLNILIKEQMPIHLDSHIDLLNLLSK